MSEQLDKQKGLQTMKQAYFDRFTIRMTIQQALDASHQGDCTSEVKDLVNDAKITRQLDKIPSDNIRAELKEYGAWDEIELSDDTANRERIIWIAAGNIREENQG